MNWLLARDSECMRHESASAVGLSLGMVFLVVGLIIDSLGVAAVGVVVLLAGLYARSAPG